MGSNSTTPPSITTAASSATAPKMTGLRHANSKPAIRLFNVTGPLLDAAAGVARTASEATADKP